MSENTLNNEEILDEANEDIVEDEAVEETVEEETAAQASLKPSNSSKSSMINQLMKYVAGMSKDDLSSFLTKTLDQVGKEADSLPDNSGKNQSSISNSGAGKPSPVVAKAVKEDVAELFADSELSEEFVDRAATLFEAAVSNRVSLELTRIEEEFESKLEEQVTASVDELHGKVNEYMDYVVEKWMEDNEVAIISNYRAEATEEFINGLKDLFEKNYVEMPEEKVDLLGELEGKVAELEESLNKVEAEKIELSKELNDSKIERAFEEVSEGLADTDAERLRTLSESIEYANVDEYKDKVGLIKEQYFEKAVKSEESTTGLIAEEQSIASNEEEEGKVIVPEEMKGYFSAIARTTRK